MTRAERAAEAARLKAEGLNGLQIAERMGIKHSYAYELLTDPDGERVRERKQSYGRPCIDCGARTDGTNGREAAPIRCAPCAKRYQHDSRKHTPESLVAMVRAFVDEHGRPPTYMRDGRKTNCPGSAIAIREFGSWNAMIEAAGFEARPVGQKRPPSERAAQIAEVVELYRSGLSLVKVGERVGMSSMGVLHILRVANEPRRPAVRPRREAVAA